MLCEKCGKNTATVRYTQIINGHKQTLNICGECASGQSLFDNFGSLFNFVPRAEENITVCPVCKMTLAEFTHSGKMGCGECYNTFRAYADNMLKKIHGTSQHTDSETADTAQKSENSPKENQELTEIEKMRAELNEAIEKEDFEKAAVLRDKIRAAEAEKEEK